MHTQVIMLWIIKKLKMYCSCGFYLYTYNNHSTIMCANCKDYATVGAIDDFCRRALNMPRKDTYHHYAGFIRDNNNDSMCSNDMITKRIHAEIAALYKQADWNIRNPVDLVVIRLSRTGTLGESRPCFHCIRKIYKSGINLRHVYYSTKEGIIKREKFIDLCVTKTYISRGNRRKT